MSDFRVGDFARIKPYENDPEKLKLYSGFIVRVKKLRPFSQLALVSTDGVNFKQKVSFDVWVHYNELERLFPEDFQDAWDQYRGRGAFYG